MSDKSATTKAAPQGLDHEAAEGHKLEHMCCTKADWQKERGREPALLAHYCDEWDGMTMDALCPEWPCACVIGNAYETGYADALKAAEERLDESRENQGVAWAADEIGKMRKGE